MKSITTLNKKELIDRTQTLAREERRITAELIDHLKEIENRRLYAELGYSSLFEFTVKHLGLSEGSAHRRISAMRLVKHSPALQEKLKSGELTVSNAAKIQVALRAVQKRPLKSNQTVDSNTLFTAIESDHSSSTSPKLKVQVPDSETLALSCLNLSQNECEQKLFELLPELEQTSNLESKRQINSNQYEIKLVVTSDLHEKINRLNHLISHSNPEMKILALLERLIDQELKSQEKKRGTISNANTDRKIIPESDLNTKPRSGVETQTELQIKSTEKNTTDSTPSKAIPAQSLVR